MDVELKAVVAAAIAMFAVGAVWYMVLFQKPWGEMFGFDKLSKKEQKEMQSQMGPYMALQFVMTLVTAFVLAKLIFMLPSYSPYMLAEMVWFGFILPTQVSAVIFGGVESKWIMRRIAIMAGGALANVLVAAWVIQMLQ